VPDNAIAGKAKLTFSFPEFKGVDIPVLAAEATIVESATI
jgi:hypothetical protein